MDRRLAKKTYLAGSYSIADMACYSWVRSAGRHVKLENFPHLSAWFARVGKRGAVQRGMKLGAELRKS